MRSKRTVGICILDLKPRTAFPTLHNGKCAFSHLGAGTFVTSLHRKVQECCVGSSGFLQPPTYMSQQAMASIRQPSISRYCRSFCFRAMHCGLGRRTPAIADERTSVKETCQADDRSRFATVLNPEDPPPVRCYRPPVLIISLLCRTRNHSSACAPARIKAADFRKFHPRHPARMKRELTMNHLSIMPADQRFLLFQFVWKHSRHHRGGAQALLLRARSSFSRRVPDTRHPERYSVIQYSSLHLPPPTSRTCIDPFPDHCEPATWPIQCPPRPSSSIRASTPQVFSRMGIMSPPATRLARCRLGPSPASIWYAMLNAHFRRTLPLRRTRTPEDICQ